MRLSVKNLSWSLYDFANTLFSAVVLTSYFPVYLSERTQGQPWFLGLATTGSMLLAGAFVPLLGALSDRTGKTKTYLFQTTFLCVFFLCGLAFLKPLPALMICFIVSCFFYHSALVFYHALLPSAAAPEEQSWVSGLGTGLGYLGVVLALPVIGQVEKAAGKPAVFLATAFLFLLFSIPLFWKVPERAVKAPEKLTWNLWCKEWGETYKIFQEIRKSKPAFLFFTGNFLTVESLNAVIFWFAVYAKQTFQITSAEIIQLLLGVNAAAFGSGLLCGWLAEKFSASKVLSLSSLTLALTLILLVFMPNFESFFAVCTLGGSFSIAGIWTAGRKRVFELAPPEKTGAYCGFYNLTVKVSVFSNLLFSLIAGWAGFKSALFFLCIPALAGYWILQKSATPPKSNRATL